jgi:hypothetical protein
MDNLVDTFLRQNNIFWNTTMLDHGYRTLLWCCRWVKKSPGIWWENSLAQLLSFSHMKIQNMQTWCICGLRDFSCSFLFMVEWIVIFGVLGVESWLTGYGDGALIHYIRMMGLVVCMWWELEVPQAFHCPLQVRYLKSQGGPLYEGH